LACVTAQAQTPSEFVTQANALYKQGDYEAAAQAYSRAIALGATKPDTYYNAACSWSLSGNADRAFGMLEQALEHGYRDVDLFETDTDLNSLRDDPRWGAVVKRCRDAKSAYLETINVELYEMYQADQADRRGDVDWSQVGPRDEARRKRALEMVEKDMLSSPDDFVHAAFIFQHGADSTSYRMAYDLASTAVALDSTHALARWITAAAKDRYLHSIGQPQIYGTQFRLIDGTWTMDPIDTTAVTDQEREWWGVQPLAGQKAREKQMNGK
jgi:tetratricopeptide (TPR) repeat protein